MLTSSQQARRHHDRLLEDLESYREHELRAAEGLLYCCVASVLAIGSLALIMLVW